MAPAGENSMPMDPPPADAWTWAGDDAVMADDLVFLGDALPGSLDTWVTVVRRDTGRPIGVYTANENRAGAGTLPDDPLVYQLHNQQGDIGRHHPTDVTAPGVAMGYMPAVRHISSFGIQAKHDSALPGPALI